MKLGVTGTRKGLNAIQRNVARRILKELVDHYESALQVHHGDCIGADVDFANMADRCGVETVAYPPLISSLRAFHASTLVLPPAGYLERDRAIVEATAALLGFPDSDKPLRTGSGTWYTINYALKIPGKKVLVIGPEGLTLHRPAG